ncbi:MAG: flagellin [Planctomycetota bacterium]|jgi:flagellin
MGLRINTNVASQTAQRNLHNVTQRLQGNFSRLSSGLRIASASDDAAGLGVSERMRSQIKSYTVASRNVQDGISMAQTAEGALNESSNLLVRMRELAVSASNGTLSTTDRATMDNEFSALNDELGRIASTTEFNGISLLDGTTSSTSIQVGINSSDTISIANQDASSSALGVESLSVSSTSGASSALSAIDAAIATVTTARGTLGSSVNRLTSAFSSILNTRENLSSAESRIRDVDVASETADLTRNSIMQQAATSVLSQANVQPQLALSLLG